MFENLVKKAATTASSVIKQEVTKGTNTRISIGLKLASVVFLALAVIHNSKGERVEKEDEPVVQGVTYNFYNANGEEVLKLCKF